ncbi:MAG: hypothetical protein VZQ51_10490, partial [Bacteroidales bacterium]|nr:hypothetical protein [Bacteroidales bacterium]
RENISIEEAFDIMKEAPGDWIPENSIQQYFKKPANQQQTKPAPAPPQTYAQPVYQQQPQAQAQPVFQQPQPQQPRPVDILQTNPDRIIVFYSNNTFAWYSPMNNSQPQPQGVYQ